jgi:hypothetical protein
MHYSKAEFDMGKQDAFKEAMASAGGISPLNVDILSITQGRRRPRKSVDVATKLRTIDAESVQKLASTLGSDAAMWAKINAELEKGALLRVAAGRAENSSNISSHSIKVKGAHRHIEGEGELRNKADGEGRHRSLSSNPIKVEAERRSKVEGEGRHRSLSSNSIKLEGPRGHTGTGEGRQQSNSSSNSSKLEGDSSHTEEHVCYGECSIWAVAAQVLSFALNRV